MGLKLVDKWLWDFWIVEDNNCFHIFYLQAPKSISDEKLRHWNTSIGHAISNDLTNWEVLPDVLQIGAPGEWDDYGTWTGSILKHEDIWYLFYTGIKSCESGLVQRIGLATSTDLMHFTKHPNNPLVCADDRWYELLDKTIWHDQAWRDPWVFYKDNFFHMLITARCSTGEPDGRGVIGYARSINLINWEVGAPITEPGEFGDLEVPSLVKINERYYLMFSVLHTSHSIARNQRLQAQPVTGIHYMVADNALGKFRFSTDKFLIGEPTDPTSLLYCGKVIECRNGNFWFLATRLTDANGDFVGELIDPIALSTDCDGNLILL